MLIKIMYIKSRCRGTLVGGFGGRVLRSKTDLLHSLICYSLGSYGSKMVWLISYLKSLQNSFYSRLNIGRHTQNFPIIGSFLYTSQYIFQDTKSPMFALKMNFTCLKARGCGPTIFWGQKTSQAYFKVLEVRDFNSFHHLSISRFVLEICSLQFGVIFPKYRCPYIFLLEIMPPKWG